MKNARPDWGIENTEVENAGTEKCAAALLCSICELTISRTILRSA